ncbi:hypothetical protein CBL_06383 [Carabus blaptoides fortunei]
MSQRKKSTPRYMSSTTSSATKYAERKLGGTPKHNISKCLDTTNVSTSSRAESISSNCSTISSVTHTNPPQKYVQHKLDMVYNKYLQNKALDIYLTKKYKELERSIDVQLSHFEEIYQSSVEDDENKKRLLRDIQMVQDAALRIQFLENALEKTCNIISDEEFTKKVKNFNQQLQIMCDSDLLAKLRKNNEIVQSYHAKVNTLTLRAASLELSKKYK